MKIRILASSDVHGFIMPYKYSDSVECNYGFLKVKSTIDKYRNENTIVIDNGDILEGSPLLTYYYHYLKDTENPMLKCLNSTYDYYNVGNHDFNNGQNNLTDIIGKFKGSCLCGNISYNGVRLGKEYVIHEFDKDNRVALVGACTHYIVNWEKPENLTGLSITPAYEYFKETVEKIRKQEDVKAIIGVYHGGYECDFDGNPLEELTGEDEAYRMCKEIEGLDVLVTGHQHRSLAGKCINTYTTQTGCNGVEIACIDLDLDTKEGNAVLIPTDEKADQKLLDEFADLEKNVQKWLDQPLGKVVDADLYVRDSFQARLHKHPVITFINKVQMETAGSMLCGNALFNDAVGFKEEITMRDLVSTYVYSNTTVVLEVTGKILKEYLEKSVEYFCIDEKGEIGVNPEFIYPKPVHFNYDMIEGMDYTAKISNSVGERIIEMKYNGKDIREDDVFTLALSNYRAGCGGNFFMFKNAKRVKEYQEDMVSMMANYLLDKKEVKINHKENIAIIK